jgi:tetratricopeptide (TPR) repeat protein
MKPKKKTPEAHSPVAVPAPPAAPGRLPWWAFAAAAAAALAAYLPALGGPFLFDDLSLPMMRPGGPESLASYVLRGVRSVTNLSFKLDFNVWGLNPAPYHLINWLLHCISSWLALRIVSNLLGRAGVEPPARALPAGFAAAVFLLHPLQTEAVSYIASRSEVLSVLFSFLALAVFLDAGDRPARWGRALSVLALLGLAVASKETAVAMGGVLILADLWFRCGFRFGKLLGNWKIWGPMFAGGAVAGAWILRIAGREGSAGFGMAGITPLDYLVTQFQVVWLYLRLFLVPIGQNLDQAFPMQKAPGSPLSWLGLAGILAVAGLAWVWRKRFPLASLGVLCFLVLLTPTSSILPIADAMAERRVYLPSLGLALILAEAVRLWKPGTARRFVPAAVLLVLTLLTMWRNNVYTSPLAMWTASLASNPSNPRARIQLADAYYRENRCSESVEHYTAAARLKTLDYPSLVNFALALDCAGKPDEASARLREATRLEPKDSHAWTQISYVEGKRGAWAAALEAAEQALRIRPDDDIALAYRGMIRMNAGQTDLARQDFQLALQINAANTIAQQGLAKTAGR